jgi:hypothetical protein
VKSRRSNKKAKEPPARTRGKRKGEGKFNSMHEPALIYHVPDIHLSCHSSFTTPVFCRTFTPVSLVFRLINAFNSN